MNALELAQYIDDRIAAATRRLRAATRVLLDAVDGGKAVGIVTVQGLAGQRLPGVEMFQEWGFKSVPPAGGEGIAVQVGGRGGHLVVIATGDRATAPDDLAAGDACIYSSLGARVVVRGTGDVEIESSSGASVTLTIAGLVQLNGAGASVARIGDTVTVTGTDSVGGPITATGIIATGSATVQAA